MGRGSTCHSWKAQSPHTPCGTWTLLVPAQGYDQQLFFPSLHFILCILRSKKKAGNLSLQQHGCKVSFHSTSPLGSEMPPKSTHAATTPLPLSPASHSTFLLRRLSQIAASQQQMQNLTLAWNLANQNENSLHIGFFSHSTALTHANGK